MINEYNIVIRSPNDLIMPSFLPVPLPRGFSSSCNQHPFYELELEYRIPLSSEQLFMYNWKLHKEPVYRYR